MKLAILEKAAPAIDKLKFVLNKKSPEIWLGAGIFAIIGGTLWACHASRHVDEIFDNHEYTMRTLKYHKEDDEELVKECTESGDTVEVDDLYFKSPNEYKKQCALTTLTTAGDLARAYAPAVILIGGGIAMVVNGHCILNKRNAALLSAYSSLEEAFTQYRKRVAAYVGDEFEQDLYSGRASHKVTRIDIDEKGKKKKVEEDIPLGSGSVSPYVSFFDQEHSSEWTPSPTYNYAFLVGQQNAANDLLRVRKSKMAKKGKPGWVFLNEVNEMLGLEQTPTGAICGWLGYLDEENPDGDDYISFGVTGWDDEVNGTMLDFNCQGVIYDKI